MAGNELGQPEADDYDDTIPTPENDASGNEQDPNPADGADVDDTPPAGDQAAADGAVDDDGVPLRADGTPARDKGEVD